jgi:hypothetical protein
LRYAYYDTTGSASGGFFGATTLVRDVFRPAAVDVVLGDSFFSATSTAAFVTSMFITPHVTYASMAASAAALQSRPYLASIGKNIHTARVISILNKEQFLWLSIGGKA